MPRNPCTTTGFQLTFILSVEFNTCRWKSMECTFRVPAWRRRLVCSVCHVRGCGACIRCEMPSCTHAFHASCAQTAGVYMRLEPAFIGANGSRAVPARRTVYCNLHRPVETSAVRDGLDFTYRLNGSLKSVKKVNKLTAESGAINAVSTSLHIPHNKLVTVTMQCTNCFLFRFLPKVLNGTRYCNILCKGIFYLLDKYYIFHRRSQ